MLKQDIEKMVSEMEMSVKNSKNSKDSELNASNSLGGSLASKTSNVKKKGKK